MIISTMEPNALYVILSEIKATYVGIMATCVKMYFLSKTFLLPLYYQKDKGEREE